MHNGCGCYVCGGGGGGGVHKGLLGAQHAGTGVLISRIAPDPRAPPMTGVIESCWKLP